MSFSTVSGSVFIKPNMGESADLVLRKTPLIATFNQLGRMFQAQGSAPFKWPVYTAANASAGLHTEGESISTFGNQTSSEASLPVVAFKATAELTGHQRANLRAGGLYNNAWQEELDKAQADLYKYAEDAFCGSSTNVGLQSIVDSAGAYAGINASSVSAWASTEQAVVSGAIYTAMNTAEAALMPYASNADLVLFAHPTAIRLFQADAAASGSASVVSAPGGGPIDLGRFPGSATFNGHPVIPVPSLPTSEIYFIDMSDASIEVLQDAEPRPLGATNNDDKVLLTMFAALKIKTRNKHGKVTGIS